MHTELRQLFIAHPECEETAKITRLGGNSLLRKPEIKTNKKQIENVTREETQKIQEAEENFLKNV